MAEVDEVVTEAGGEAVVVLAAVVDLEVSAAAVQVAEELAAAGDIKP